MSMVVLTVVQHEARVLLVEEAKARVRGTWNLPGGRVEPHEGLIEAAEREVAEEAGIAIELVGLLLIHLGPSFADPTQTVTRFVFVARPRESAPAALKSQPDEHSLRAQWLSLEELRQLPLRNPHVLEFIELATRGSALLPLSSVRSSFGAV